MAVVHATGAPRPCGPLCASARWIGILIVLLSGPAADLRAQSMPAVPQVSTRPASFGADAEASAVELLVGRSIVLNVPGSIQRVSLTSPEVADALVTTSQQVLIHGKAPGTISMFVWDRGGGIRRYQVIVRRDLSELETQVQQLFPGEPIVVASNGKAVVISGTVSSKYVMDKAGAVAAGYVETQANVVNLLQQREGVASNQVMLHVRFAEVSRSAMQELGASFFANGYKQDWTGRTAPPGVAAPNFQQDGSMTFSDFLNLFVFNSKEGLGAVVKALASKGLFQSLAEPNLVATNGKEASFLAGGEYPYPVAQSSGGGTNVTIMFKEFGIRLSFTPTMLGGDLIHLKVRPEVSALDFSNAVTLEGFRIPALTTRRTETEVELRDGQTFAIAGLMNNTVTNTISKIPGLGDIPILGLLFKSRAYQKNQTELVVMITPEILRPNSPGAARALPNLEERFLPPVERPLPPPPPYSAPGVVPPAAPVGNTRTRVAVEPTGDAQRATSVASSPSPSAAAAPIVAAKPAATRQERQAIERAEREERKRMEADALVRQQQDKFAADAARVSEKRAAERAAVEAIQGAELARAEQKRAAEAMKLEQKVKLEQAWRNAQVARKAEEDRKKQDEIDRRRGKALAEAEARLKEAQAAYQATVGKRPTDGSTTKQ